MGTTYENNPSTDSNMIQTHNHLVHKRTLNHLAIYPFSQLNPFMTEAVNQWTGSANQWADFYLMTASVMKGLNFRYRACFEQGVP